METRETEESNTTSDQPQNVWPGINLKQREMPVLQRSSRDAILTLRNTAKLLTSNWAPDGTGCECKTLGTPESAFQAGPCRL